jgi:hypothetical protein
MNTRKQLTTWRKRAQLTTLAALPILMLAPFASRAAHAESAEEAAGGAGTEFVACQNAAWHDYNECLMSSDHEWEKKICDLAFQADIVWCGSVYWKRVQNGS